MPDPTVPLLDFQAQYAGLKPEIDEAIARVVASQRFVLGPEVESLEEELARRCGVRAAVGCASGTDALLLALMALDVRPGDDVVCPAYTFFATAGSVARLGAVPVFADVDPATCNMSPEACAAAAARCRRLKAIMPVHLFGRVADMEAIERIGRERGVPVIEDAAQAIGARDERGRPAGATGLIGCFSFYPTKNLGAYGDAGLLTTDDAGLARRLASLRVHGGTDYIHEEVGINSRLDAIQAAVLRVKLARLDAWNDARIANASTYDRLFAEAGAGTWAEPIDDEADGLPLRTPPPSTGRARQVYHHYVIRVPARVRDALREHLGRRGIGTAVYYPLPLHLQRCFRDLGYAEGDLPHSELAAKQTLAIPVHPDLDEAQLRHVVEATVAFLEQPAPVAPRSG